jgi:hypothetical protein
MTKYQNTKWNLSLHYPADWQVAWENEADAGWEIVVGLAGKPSRSGRPFVTVRVLKHAVLNFEAAQVDVFAAGGSGAPAKLDRTPEEYNESCKRDLAKVFPAAQFISDETGPLAGMPSAMLLYEYNGSSGTIREKQINVFGATVTYRLMCEMPEEQIEPVSRYFDSVVAAFKPFAGT